MRGDHTCNVMTTIARTVNDRLSSFVVGRGGSRQLQTVHARLRRRPLLVPLHEFKVLARLSP